MQFVSTPDLAGQLFDTMQIVGSDAIRVISKGKR